jgi:hypothetical protein
MRRRSWRIALVPFIGIFLSLACGLAGGSRTGGPFPDAGHTQVAVTIYSMQTEISASGTLAAASVTATDTPTATFVYMPSVYVTAQNPVVIDDTLCWLGPGPGYEVSSAVRAGTRVVLLGYGSLPGWWVISNPVYHDPCWIPQQDLQIDLNYSLNGLQVFYPPPTATSTRTPKPTRTPTATPTP